MKSQRLFRKTAIALAMLLAFGWLRSPVESKLTDHFVETGALTEVSTSQLSSAVGQSTVLAVLGGLRPLVAIYLTLHAFDAWSFREWDTVERDYRIITTLMPEDIDSWKTGAWHMAYNAAASALYDAPTVPDSVKKKNSRDWVYKGIEFMEKGIEQNPNSAVLHQELADIYRQQLDEPCLAAKHYKLSMEGDRPKSFVARFYGYFLARCPGREKEAYDHLMELYHQGQKQRLPTLISRIKELEETLEIPAANRIPEIDPDEEILRRYPHAKPALP